MLTTTATTSDSTGAIDVAPGLQREGLDVRPLPEAPAGAGSDALRAAVDRHDGPLLLRGLIADWPASTEWSPLRLACRRGAHPVTALMGLPSSGVLFPVDQRFYEQQLPMADFVEAMLTASPESPCYLAYQRDERLFPPDEHDVRGLLGPRIDVDPDTRVWIGSAGTRSMLHSDLKDNLFCQVWGQKHIVLVPWEDSLAAYPFPDNVVNSQVDLAWPDLERFPLLRETVLYAGTVGPSDVLFIPRGWWHDIRAGTPSVSLNHWFGPRLELRDYARLLVRLGPRCWWSMARDFMRSGVLGRTETTTFFFSPPSTGKRLFDAVRWNDFSRDNDPVT
jgi:lysine-specific demethylase 8